MSEFLQGTVVASRGKYFDVRGVDHVVYRCDVRQKVKQAADRETPVAVGDDVLFTDSGSGDNTGAIDKVLPRKSTFGRPAKGGETATRQIIAANLDQLAIVVSVVSPPLKTGLIDRFILAGRIGQMDPLVIINKVDLDDSDEVKLIAQTYRDVGYKCHLISAQEEIGLADVTAALKDHRTLFVGHSGVGKSSLLNALAPELKLKTNEVSAYSNRGKHTTTSIELYELPSGGFVADSPGLKVMGFDEIHPDSLPDYYPEFERFRGNCKFQPCSHLHEPGCAVKAALEKGLISRFRYDNYVALSETL